MVQVHLRRPFFHVNLCVGKSGLIRLPWEQETAGSNPAVLTVHSGVAEWRGVGLLNQTMEVQFLPPELYVPLAERQRCQSSKLARRVRFPQGTLAEMIRGRRCW